MCVDDSVDTLRLRRAILCMRGHQNISGTDLRKCNVFGDLTPEQWKNGDGRRLEELGLITINGRSYGFSVTKATVPSSIQDPRGYDEFETLLHNELRLTVEDYADSLAPPVARQRQPRNQPEPRNQPQQQPTQHRMKAEPKEDVLDEDDVEFIAGGFVVAAPVQPAAAVAESSDLRARPRPTAKRSRVGAPGL